MYLSHSNTITTMTRYPSERFLNSSLHWSVTIYVHFSPIINTEYSDTNHARLSPWLGPNTICQPWVEGTTCRLQLPHDDYLQVLPYPEVDWTHSLVKFSAHGVCHLPSGCKASYSPEGLLLSPSFEASRWQQCPIPLFATKCDSHFSKTELTNYHSC